MTYRLFSLSRCLRGHGFRELNSEKTITRATKVEGLTREWERKGCRKIFLFEDKIESLTLSLYIYKRAKRHGEASHDLLSVEVIYAIGKQCPLFSTYK